MSQQSRLPHVVRGSTAAVVATFVALLSHVSAGGAMPGSLGIIAPLALSLFVCVLLAGRKLSVLRLSVSVIASQTLFHSLFVLGTEQAGLAGGSAHSHHMMAAAALPAPMLSESTITLIQGDTLMWASHVLGAIATVVFLAQGERTLLFLRDLAVRTGTWLQLAFAPQPAPVPLTAPIRAPRIVTTHWTALDQLRASSLYRRGPPRLTEHTA